MEPITSDFSLCMKSSSENTIRLFGNYIDDYLFAGDAEFLHSLIRQKKCLSSTAWFQIRQNEYIKKLSRMEPSIDFEKFQSVRAAVSWIHNSRSDKCYSANLAYQFTNAQFSARHIKFLNESIMKVKETKALCLNFRPLDRNTLQLLVYSDASFATNEDHSSQFGYLILLVDYKNNCHNFPCFSKKS